MNNNPESFTHIERTQNPEIKMGAATIASTKHSENEDAAYMSSDSKSPLKVFAVFDGMGGHEGGADASSTALHTVKNHIENGNVDPHLTLAQTEGLIKSALLKAHEAVKTKSIGEKGMGTTASIGMIWEGQKGEKKLVVGNVGDSSMYIFRKGRLTKLTVDDDLAHEGHGNILTQAIGLEDIEPRMGVFDILAGDQIITLSDGIPDAMSENLEEEFYKALTEKKGNPTEAANALVKKAREFSLSGRKMDDQTALVVEIANTSSESVAKKAPTLSPEIIKNQQEKYRLTLGTMVKVKRSDGRIEDGWFIVGNEGAKIKIIDSSRNTKTATPEQLDSLNPPIKKTDTWENLMFAINQLDGVIKGSNKNYTKEEMSMLVDQARRGMIPTLKITRSYGLREKVEELIALNKSREELQSISK